MALQSAILVPAATNGVTATLAGTTASAAIVIGTSGLFAINADQNLSITFGLSGGVAASTPSGTVGFVIPSGAIFTFDLGANFDSFKIYNTSGTSTTYSYQQLSRF